MLQFLQGLLKEVAPNSKTHLGASVSHLQTTNAGYSPGLYGTLLRLHMTLRVQEGSPVSQSPKLVDQDWS